jgi:hypothetical protein
MFILFDGSLPQGKTLQLLKLIITINLLWLILGASIAQEEPLPLYLFRDNQLYQLDVETGELTLVTPVIPVDTTPATDPGQIDRHQYKLDIDADGRYLYRIEAWGRSKKLDIWGAPTGAELVRIDIETGERKVILDNKTVFNFALSPDGKSMVVFFYAGEFLYSTQQACILNLETFECPIVKLEYVGTKAIWVSDEAVVIGTNDIQPLRLIDAKNGLMTVLDVPSKWYVYWGSLIAMSNTLLLAVVDREQTGYPPVNFLTYDLSSGNIEILPLTAKPEYLVVEDLSISPDRQFLLYGGRSQAILVDFKSGQALQEFTAVYAADWIDEQTLLVQGTQNEGAMEIMRVNAATGEVITLRSGDEALGLLLMPGRQGRF